MSDSQQIESTIRDYFAAVSTGSADNLALADSVELTGPMLAEPLHGKDAVDEYFRQVAPFLTRMEVLEIIIDRNSAAARVLIHTINGVEVEGAFFFRIFQGQISRVRSLFDTLKLMTGRTEEPA